MVRTINGERPTKKFFRNFSSVTRDRTDRARRSGNNSSRTSCLDYPLRCTLKITGAACRIIGLRGSGGRAACASPWQRCNFALHVIWHPVAIRGLGEPARRMLFERTSASEHAKDLGHRYQRCGRASPQPAVEMGLSDANWLTTFRLTSRGPTRFHIGRLYFSPPTRCKNERNLHNSSDFDVKQHLQEANLTLAGKAHELLFWETLTRSTTLILPQITWGAESNLKKNNLVFTTVTS